jgi:hypothetical protein
LNPPAESRLLDPPRELVTLIGGRREPQLLGNCLRPLLEDLERRRPIRPLDPAVADATRYGGAALRRACQAVAAAPRGQRNDILNREGYGIAQLVAGGEIVERVALEWLTEAGMSTGLPEWEVRRTIQSAWIAGSSTPRRAGDAA